MIPLLNTLMFVLNMYIWILIATAIFSWLYAFNVVNTRNQFVSLDRHFPLQDDRTGAWADPSPHA